MAKVTFSHIHAYCDSLKELAEYKKLEGKLCAFAKEVSPSLDGEVFKKGADIEAGRKAWLALSKEHGDPITGQKAPEEWKMQKQDLVEQMLVGIGWRITGMNRNSETCTFGITSPDPNGVKFLVTAHNSSSMQELGGEPPAKRAKTDAAVPHHFCAAKLATFAAERVGRQGFAVLGFSTPAGGVDLIRKKYSELHPKLLLPDMPQVHGNVKILEVYAYYKGDKCVSDADRGTILRFVEGDDVDGQWAFPGLEKVEAKFDGMSLPAFCDHWVSNVVSRTGFLATLEDTLGFTPKVDFNAGVVAAGEAQIESTVTGNTPGIAMHDEAMALKDQSQVYLPTNNALSEVGHVHLYLKEIGQGIQHIASRVKDLPCVVQRANDYRKMTGAGLNFLSIPRTYYGTLTAEGLGKDAQIDAPTAEKCIDALKKAGIVDRNDIVDLDLTRERAEKALLPAGIDKAIVEHVMRGRYRNLYSLLREHLSEDKYLQIVRNNILIDVQGNDLLMQIFTNMVLLREPGQEAPFLELIQRICSDKKDPKTGKPKAIKPGCGGFGIRNFLTLFLAIEVGKATKGKADALQEGKTEVAEYFGGMCTALTSQLEESNPVLTAVSDAMTAEGEAQEQGDSAAVARHSAEKAKGQEQLMTISMKYKNMLKQLREKAPAGV